jgi:hypothetical protein
VFTTTSIRGYPGMSGGPVCVRYTNGRYYPAGVFLGGAGQAVVRAIDGAVADLINRADFTANTGQNNTGGGVITITVGSGGSGLLAYVQVTLGPPAAVAAGAAWRIQGTTAWSTGTTYTAALAAGGSVTLEFKPIVGWNLPANQALTLVLGQTTTVSALYTLSSRLGVTPSAGFSASGFAGGPFSPALTTYTLTNSGGASLNWSGSKTANWLSLSVSNGTLAAGARTNVTVSLNADANSLAPGNYSGTVIFTNSTTGLGSTNFPVSLSVALHPPVVLANAHALTNGNLSMTLQGVTNRVYSILGTTNLLRPITNWPEVLRLTNSSGQTTFTITNPAPVVTPQYYRAKEL